MNYIKLHTNMSNRNFTASEIQAVGSLLNDKNAIELLKKINNSVVTADDDTKTTAAGSNKKEQQQQKEENDLTPFVGFAHQKDVLGEDKESDDYKTKAGAIQNLVNAGLVIEGSHTPLAPKDEEKHGDLRLSSEERISKYKLTEEGLTVLAVVGEDIDAPKQAKQQQTAAQIKQQSNENNNNSKEQQTAAYKEQVKKENKR